jgi:hypothetical protein
LLTRCFQHAPNLLGSEIGGVCDWRKKNERRKKTNQLTHKHSPSEAGAFDYNVRSGFSL